MIDNDDWNTRAERTTQNVTDAWNDWGVNVFNDDELDDFGRFEKVYKVCQEDSHLYFFKNGKAGEGL